MYDFEDETGNGLGAGVTENRAIEEVKEGLFLLRDKYHLNGDKEALRLIYDILDFLSMMEQ